MKRGFWLFLAAVSISFFAVDRLLDGPPAQRDTPVRTDRSAESKSKAAEAETVDMPESEDRMPAEQLAGPLRNAAHLSGTSAQPPPPDSEDKTPSEEVAAAKQTVKSPEQGALPVSEDEEAPNDTASDESDEEDALLEEGLDEEFSDDTDSDELDQEEVLPEEDSAEALLNENALPDSEEEEAPDDTDPDEPEEEEGLSQ